MLHDYKRKRKSHAMKTSWGQRERNVPRRVLHHCPAIWRWSGQEPYLVSVFAAFLQVVMYDQHGKSLKSQFSFGESCSQEGVSRCQIYSSGIVILTERLVLWIVTDLYNPSPQRMAALKVNGSPSCMAVLDPKHTISGSPEVKFATTHTSVFSEYYPSRKSTIPCSILQDERLSESNFNMGDVSVQC